jgi:hypothetical protein
MRTPALPQQVSGHDMHLSRLAGDAGTVPSISRPPEGLRSGRSPENLVAGAGGVSPAQEFRNLVLRMGDAMREAGKAARAA